jgi:hypothetical protein
MFSFKTFLKETDLKFGYVDLLLSEELTQEQKNTVDNWGDGSAARALSNHVFPKGQDRIEIPLKMEETPVVPHPGVQKHLEDNGYSINDYKGGFATDKYGRSVSIGKILNKTKAPADITNAFMNDPQRAASSVAQPKIIISRHPHDVAGMSTDRGWRSCMEMGGPNGGGGINQHYLRHDIANGTHVAYLVRPEDNDIKKPMARIALKPFHSDDEIQDSNDPYAHPIFQSTQNKHTILRPESNVYGIGKGGDFDNAASGVDSGIVSSFKNTIRNWTNQNFPMKENTTYIKNQDVYNDDGKSTVMPFEKAINSSDPRQVGSAFDDHPEKITPEHLSKVLNSDDTSAWSYYPKISAIQHKLSTPEQVLKASYSKSEDLKHAALQNPKLPQSRVQDVLMNKQEDDYTRYNVLQNQNIPAETLHHVIMDRNDDIRSDALAHNNVSINTLNEIVRSPHYRDSILKKKAIQHKNFTSPHIDAVLENPTIDSQLKQTMIKSNPNITKDHLSKIVNGENSSQGMISAAVSHAKTSPKTISDYLSNDTIHPNDKLDVLQKSPKINSGHIDTVLNSSTNRPEWYSAESELKELAARHTKATPDALDKLILNSQDDNLKLSALSNKNAKSETLDKVANDPEEQLYIRKHALRNQNISDNTLTNIVKNGNEPELMETVFRHPNATQKHIDMGANHPDPKVRYKALASDRHDLITKQHVINALGDSSYDVSYFARQMAEWKLDAHDQIYAMSHPNPEVRQATVMLDKLTKEAHSMAIKDEHPMVRAVSVLSRHTTPAHIEALHQDPDHTVRALSTISNHIQPEHLTNMANDPSHVVRMAVAGHKNTPEDIRMNMAQNDPEEKVRDEASRKLTSA